MANSLLSLPEADIPPPRSAGVTAAVVAAFLGAAAILHVGAVLFLGEGVPIPPASYWAKAQIVLYVAGVAGLAVLETLRWRLRLPGWGGLVGLAVGADTLLLAIRYATTNTLGPCSESAFSGVAAAIVRGALLVGSAGMCAFTLTTAVLSLVPDLVFPRLAAVLRGDGEWLAEEQEEFEETG